MGKVYHAIGLMSGSSLDGLDIAYCRLEADSPFQLLSWNLLEAGCQPFSTEWEERLRNATQQSGAELALTSTDFGRYMGQLVNSFFKTHHIRPDEVDFIASHGHTVFHEPAQGFTLQIGDGAALAATTGCPVICDFRSADVALGGQGAPLAPMADKLLFPGYDFYLNLGGIANITCNAGGHFIAFDITGANQVLNSLATELGYLYDDKGHIAAAGRMDKALFDKLNELPFLGLPFPKSLSNQWVRENMIQNCNQSLCSVEDKLNTVCCHVAFQIKKSILAVIENENFEKTSYSMLATGGGVFNDFLMECIRKECDTVEVVLPELALVKYKEACLMALLGIMRLYQVPNCMSSVTGAKMDAIGGAIYSGQRV